MSGALKKRHRDKAQNSKNSDRASPDYFLLTFQAMNTLERLCYDHGKNLSGLAVPSMDGVQSNSKDI